MKFEKLSESNGKVSRVFLYGLIIGVGLLIILNLFLTKAKYKIVDSTKLVNSTINYSNADFSLISLNVEENNTDEPVEEESKKYTPSNTVPTDGNYALNENKSYCTAGDSKELVWGTHDGLTNGTSKIEVKFKDGSLTFSKVTEKNTKCYLWFDKEFSSAEGTLANLYKDDLKVTEDAQKCPQPDSSGYASITSISKEKGTLLCKGIDDDGDTYYFRGKAEKNWVLIDKTYWRIVRINGNGSIRLIYNGSGTSVTGYSTMALTNKPFNERYDDNVYVGYMYGTRGASSYDIAHANINLSNILTELQTWYKGSVIPEKIKTDYIDGNAGFCGDRTPYASSSGENIDKNYGHGSSSTFYGGNIRSNNSPKKATFKCPQINQDLYTTSDSERGNRALPVPVGLVSIDEAMFAGGTNDLSNNSYYLYNGLEYWTISPSYCNGIHTDMETINKDGFLSTQFVQIGLGVRPVINLKANTPFIEGGDGSSSNPFTVKLD